MRQLLLSFGILLLAGCTANVQQLRDLKPSADDFPGALASEYLAYSDSELEQGHTFSAQYYAGKGLKSANGEAVEPETADTSLPEASQQELAAARSRLMELMTDKVKKKAPQKLARAQLLFDCWQHELTQGLTPEQAPCSDEFHAVIVELLPLSDASLYDKITFYTLDFAPHSAQLSAEGKALVKTIAQKVAKKKRFAIDVQSHSSGGEKAAALSEARLRNVVKALIQAGVVHSRIQTVNEDDSKKVFLSSDEAPEDTNQIIVTLKTNSKSR